MLATDDRQTSTLCPTLDTVSDADLDGGAGTLDLHPLIGCKLNGRYRIDELIGRGGMSLVFRGRQLEAGRNVAIKLLRPELSHQPRFRSQLRQEAGILGRLEHPNTLRLYDFGTTPGGEPFLVMELLAGRTLRSVTREGRALRVSRAARIAGEICRSLSEAHGLGIIHRDLKPENVFLQTVGTEEMVKVIDFGISHSDESTVSPSGAIFSGTPSYLAPERLRDEPLDHRSDIYSLGVMLYEMLSGDVPFASASMSRLLFMHLSQTPAPLRSVHPDLSIPPELDRLVLQMLAKHPHERPQSVAEVKARLKSWIR